MKVISNGPQGTAELEILPDAYAQKVNLNTNNGLPLFVNGVQIGSDKRTINAQVGASYTTVLADGSAAGGSPLLTMANAGAQTCIIPPNASVPYPIGTVIDVLQLGAGKVTIQAGAGVTILNTNKAISAQYAGVSVLKTAINTWVIIGSTIA